MQIFKESFYSFLIFGIKKQIIKAKLTEEYDLQTKMKCPRKQTFLAVAAPHRQLVRTKKKKKDTKRITFHAS